MLKRKPEIDVRELSVMLLSIVKNYTIDKPVKGAELCQSLNIEETELRDIVRYMRRLLIPIGAHTQGYYYAHNADELKVTIDQLENRAMSLKNTLKPLHNLYRQWLINPGKIAQAELELGYGGLVNKELEKYLD